MFCVILTVLEQAGLYCSCIESLGVKSVKNAKCLHKVHTPTKRKKKRRATKARSDLADIQLVESLCCVGGLAGIADSFFKHLSKII